MDRRYIVVATLAVLVASLVGFRFGAVLYKRPSPHVSEMDYDIRQVGGKYTIVFSGSVVNPRRSNVYDVTVHIRWSEMGGGRHVDSVFVGDMAGGSTVSIEKTFEFEYMITLGSYNYEVEFSETQ
ncbi:MAG: hypothetical protein AMS17_02360 [Spirochaetes bacterium DG_61]|jgi:hypothetical protein|nr:MAG: hypothetical protein AMS17_02360 [Spirochaetes bacterium DG_61]